MLTCRTVAMDACEVLTGAGADVRPPLNTDPLYIRLGDTLDFGIDWSAWLAANKARLKTSAWAAAGSPVASPQSPTLSSPQIDITAGITSTLVNASAAAAGDSYFLENTIVIVPADAGAIAWADRTIVRRINILVASG